MQPTTAPTLSLTPLFAPTADSPDSLQNTAILAENAAAGASGLFASLLSRLALEEPSLSPVVPDTTAVLPAIAPVIAVEVLPPAGNLLPLLIDPAPVEPQTQPLVSEALLPLPGLPQSIPVKPIVSSTAIITGESAIAAPVAAAVIAKPVLTKPLSPVRTLTPDGPGIHSPVAAEAKTAIDPTQTLAAATGKEIPVELSQQLNNRQPAQIIAADSSTAFNTVTPATPQPLSPTTPAAQHSFTLNHPIADARWGDSLGQRVIWMTENGMGRAEIRLNPPELGPLHVRVSVVNDEAKVAFNVQHGTTRELVEAALPRLREMFAQHGIELTDASVSQHSPDDRRQAGDRVHESNYDNAQDIAGIENPDAITGNAIIREGLIDTYA